MEPVRVPSIPAATFPSRRGSEGLRRLAYNLHWAWHPRTRGLFQPEIDRTPGSATAIGYPGDQRPDRVVPSARRREVPGGIPRRARRVRPVHGERLGPLVPAADMPTRCRARSPTSARNTASTNRWASIRVVWRPRRRPHEVGERHGHACHRRRLALPQGLFPPDDRCRRRQETNIPTTT